MNAEDFLTITHQQLGYCLKVLKSKAEIYADEDRLINFKQAARLQEVLPTTALLGMFSKHIVSLSTLLGRLEDPSVSHGSSEQWKETITDSINYLLLLNALLTEGGYIHGKAVKGNK